ncbi:MAG: hypothetical protein A2017_13170 [Lentisphaerae bacterium GWF2_44_16]|nr:MAG: hypothetical protein A2017_13170 [Lentisphaerae bacterium GWF2_44_16]
MKAKFYIVSFLFGFSFTAFAWGGPEHSSITAAALSVLSPALIGFLGSEAARLIKTYCNYPDFNWCVYGTSCKGKDGQARLPDDRRDINASFYCDFDEFTGRGAYCGHGPEIGKEMPPPDEHSRKMYERREFGSFSAEKNFRRADEAFRKGNYFEAIRFMGVVIHYIEDATPPPHTIGIPGGRNHLHHEMEALSNHSLINIGGYKPAVLGKKSDEATREIRKLADAIALNAQGLAKKSLVLVEEGKKTEAEMITVECAKIAAMAAADVLNTLYEIHKDNLPLRPVSAKNRNLLFNPSFDEDGDGDMQPDGWVREWNDLKCPFDMHLWDRVSAEKGACVRLYGTSEKGASWRTSKAYAIPVQAGETYELKAKIRVQTASGKNYISLRFQDKNYNTVAEIAGESFTGSEFWKEISVKTKVPDGAVDMMAVCFSSGNSGSVLFDELELKLLSV